MHPNFRYLLDYCRHQVPPGGRILDFGCGKGAMVAEGRNLDIDIYGADIFYKDGSSREAVEKLGLLGTIVREIHGGKLDFPAGHFDLVVSNQVFEHVQDLDGALEEIARVLKPGGKLHALFPVRETWWEGHFGIPFLHNFTPGRVRRAYARIWHGLSLGYHRSARSSGEWADYACDWIDRYTTYRSMREIETLLARHFSDATFVEGEYLQRRMEQGGTKYAIPRRINATGVGKWLATIIYRKRGGVVVTATRGA